MKKIKTVFALASLLALSPLAWAGTITWDFSGNGPALVFGKLTTSDVLQPSIGPFGLAGYQGLDITGTWNSLNIVGLVTTPVPSTNYDNALVMIPQEIIPGFFVSHPQLDNYGLELQLSDGTMVNIYSAFVPTGGGYMAYFADTSADSAAPFSVFTIAQDFSVPAPGVPDGSSTFLLTGIALVGLIVFKQRHMLLPMSA